MVLTNTARQPINGEDNVKPAVNSELTDISGILSSATTRISALGDSYGPIASQLGKLHERLAQGRFHLAVLGQFKRGKSTLLNALLGEAVLPTAAVPLTAISTFIRPGESLSTPVRFQKERDSQQAEVDRSLPASAQHKRIRERLLDQVEELVVANVENLRWATFQSIDQTFSQFGLALDELLAETIEATHGAIYVATKRRQSDSAVIAHEEEHIRTVTMELDNAIDGPQEGDAHEQG